MKNQRGAIDYFTLALCLLVALAWWAFYMFAYTKGHDDATRNADQATAKRQAANQQERARQTEAARTAETELRTQADRLNSQLQESQDHATHMQSQLDSHLRSGTRRLSVRTTSCTAAAIPAHSAAQPGALGPEEARADIHPADAAAIAAITAEADTTARELNHCIDRYESAAVAVERYKLTLIGPHVETAKPARPH